MPELKLYNTLTREKEVFEPLMNESENWKKYVGMYSCGPTVYSTPHIGNFRATFTADLIRNTLKYFGYPVKVVMNITDVGHLVSDADDGEDKLEKWSRIDGISAWDVAKKYEVGLKEHNGDYQDEGILLAHPALGITAMNVAPEYGTVETRAYLKLIELEEMLFVEGIISKKSNLKNCIRKEAVASRRWEKWMTDDTVSKTTEELLQDEEIISVITDISGHYTFNNDNVKEEIETLFENLSEAGVNAEEYVIYKLKESLDRYVECFNLKGYTSRLKKIDIIK